MQVITQTIQIGKLVCEKRKKQKLTQEQLAAMCSVGIRFIRELEKMKESCHLGKTITIINAPGLSLTIEDE